MNPRDDLDRKLDGILDEIRSESPDARSGQQATDRVWNSLQRELEASAESEPASPTPIHGCESFQGMLADYTSGRLAKARRLLLEDHLGECVPCRRALKRQRTTGHEAAPARRERSWATTAGWRLAAAAVIFVGLIGLSFKTDVFSFSSGGMIHIEAIDGDLFRVTQAGTVPVNPGEAFELEKGEGLLTGKGSTAVLRLADDSMVEMRERSQLAVLEKRHLLPGRRADGVIDLDRGSIIVEASDQGSGHLYVDTRDCNVAVTGTVFAVRHGMKGSRVSVVEGEVRVNYGGSHDVLQPGEQSTTSASLARVPVEQDIAWSRNRDRYNELLEQMREMGRELDEALRPGHRYSTALLDRMPAGTVVYVAMPNISEELADAYDIVESRVASNEALREWWEGQVATMGGREKLEQAIARIRDYGDHLDEEIVLTVQITAGGKIEGPLFLAQTKRPEAFMDMLRDELAQVEDGHASDVQLIEGPLPTGLAPATELVFWTHDDILAVTPDLDMLRTIESGMDQGNLQGTEFHRRLSDLYTDGVEWAVGVDLQRILTADDEQGDHEALERLGLLDVQHVIAERKQDGDRTENRVTLTFDQPRRKMASWLAEPAPIGALDYVGPEANFVVAFAMRDMQVLVEDLVGFASSDDPDGVLDVLTTFEQETGINLIRDIAAPLGGEFAVALDGPVLPTPSWKLVVQVYDPMRFLLTLDRLVERLNEHANEAGSQGVALSRERVGDRDYFQLEVLDLGMTAHVVYDNGYLVAGPSKAMLDRTLQNRAMGIRLADSPAFVEQMPHDSEVNFSGVIYQNLAPVLGPLAKTLGHAIDMGGMGEEERAMIEAAAAQARPSMALLYGLEDSIRVSASTEGGLFTSGFNSLTGFGSVLGMPESVFRAVEAGAREADQRGGQDVSGHN